MAAVVVEIAMTATPERFSTHDKPAWEDRANFIINAPLPEPGRFEQLWCRQMSSDTFEVCCIPFFLYDVALGDVVQTIAQGGRKYVFSHVLSPSGRYVLRAYFERSMLKYRDQVADGLMGIGALLEWSSASLLAGDARDVAHGQQIADFLFERENLGQLIYESGKTV